MMDRTKRNATIFKVPNDETGREFIKLARKYVCASRIVRVRGRSTNIVYWFEEAKNGAYETELMPANIQKFMGV